MSYKSILVHVDQSPHASARIEFAAELARTHEAHLTGAALTGLAMDIYRSGGMTWGAPVPQDVFDTVKEDNLQALALFEKLAQAAAISYERRYTDDDPDFGLVQQAHYADLVVLSQSDPDSGGPRMLHTLPEYVALNGGRPVLMVPYSGTFRHLDRHALVAWDGSRAATRAITDALPLLQRSGQVTLAVFDAERQYGVHGDLPGADIALFLARHGVKVEVQQHATAGGIDIGGALLSLAADLGADLLVMGAYGHQRWSEIILGGVTRRILQSMTLPVLMSH
ncbi:universal stress protein [Pseudoduganella aquatica]|uniref:Universal stress protein n=1 Tax=Pseudoduganella aquatica TaxID=2660641 RepID=A0A7X4HAJ6_9BURK|nr:universal stress protein [Pseudoduganella aquatica]MYN06767.1 universal stress protein [Pseudoduganella aquatica]